VPAALRNDVFARRSLASLVWRDWRLQALVFLGKIAGAVSK